MVEKALERHQIDVGEPGVSLLPEATAVPDANIRISAGNYTADDDQTLATVAAAVVGPFGVFTGGGADVERWDLVTLNTNTGMYAIATGTDQPAGVYATSVPAVPFPETSICAVRVTEAGTVVVIQDDIVDSRQFYLAPHGDLGLAGATTDRRHKTEQLEHTQITAANWQIASPGTVSAHLEELAGLFPVWCRKSSDFANLQDAIDDLYASKAKAGILTLDIGISLSGSTTVDGSKPLFIIGSGAGVNQINMDSGTITFDAAGSTEIAPITFIDVFLLRQGTDTGAFNLVDRGVLTFEDCRLEDTSSTATLPLFDITAAAGEMVLVLRRTKITSPSTNASYFDISGPGTYKIYGYRFSADTSGTEKLFKRSGGGSLDIYLADHSIVLISDWGAVPGVINMHYDGTSLLTGDTTNDVNADLNEVDGEAMFTIDFTAIVTLDLVLQFAAATHLILGAGSHIMSSVALIGGTDRVLHVRGLDRVNSVIFGSGIASGTFIGISGSTGTYTFENLTIRVTGSGGGSAIILSAGFARIRHVTVEINSSECNTGVSGSNLFDVLAVGVGTTFKSVAIVVTGSRASAINCQVSGFESRGFDLIGQDCMAVNCTARMDDGAAGMVAFNMSGGAKATNCVAFFAGGGSAIATSTGFKLDGATTDESHGCQISNCGVDGENGASRLAVAVELLDDGNIVTGCRFAHTTSHGANLQSTVNFSTLSGNQFRDIGGDGIRIDGSIDNIIASNMLAGVSGTEIIEVAASGADFNLIHGNHLRGGTITTVGAGTASALADNLT